MKLRELAYEKSYGRDGEKLLGQNNDVMGLYEVLAKPAKSPRDKLRLRMHLDTSYASQSHGAAELWTGRGWTKVVELLTSDVTRAMEEARVWRRKSGDTKSRAFAHMRDTLLERASLVLDDGYVCVVERPEREAA